MTSRISHHVLKHLSRASGGYSPLGVECQWLKASRVGVSVWAKPVTERGTRYYATKPEASIYGGPQAGSPKRVTLRALQQKYNKGEKLTMMTAYDYPSAVHEWRSCCGKFIDTRKIHDEQVDKAGIDILLVGDSAGMVVHGFDTTLPLTLDMMLVHCQAVSRGTGRPFLIGDMPFGTYEISAEQAVDTAVQFLKVGNVDAVKLEGGTPARVEAVRAVVRAGVACMGHIGLTPQSVSALGGFRPQAKNADAALKLVEVAQELEQAGAFALVLECVPAAVAAAVTKTVSIPTIGIGAGTHCSGQVLVFHDLLGMMSHPHHQQVTPKFCKQYAQVGLAINEALQQYKEDVESGSFPGPDFSPYEMCEEELDKLTTGLIDRGLHAAVDSVASASSDTLKKRKE